MPDLADLELNKLQIDNAAQTSSTAPALVNIGGVYRSSADTYTSGDAVVAHYDTNGNEMISSGTAIAGEDLTNNILVTEQRYSYFAPVVADAAIKSGAGFVHTITISQADAAPTAGTIQVRDSTSAGAGTVMFEWNLTTAVFNPFTIILDASFGTGLYIDFTTTGDVNVQGSYR